MVQEFYVLKCHSCDIFQVHIVKKAKKWICKICNSKQSIQKVYGQGNSKDCRIHVQKLNKLKETHDCPLEQYATMQDSEDFKGYCNNENENLSCSRLNKRIYNELDGTGNSKKSKWDVYVDNDSETSKKEDIPLMAFNKEKKIDYINTGKIYDYRSHFKYEYLNENEDKKVYCHEREMKRDTLTDNVSEDEKRKKSLSKHEYKFDNCEKPYNKLEAFPYENQSKKTNDSTIKSGLSDMKIFKFANSNDEDDIDNILTI